MVRNGEDLAARGLLLASQSLKSNDSAPRVQVRDGQRHVLDGRSQRPRKC